MKTKKTKRCKLCHRRKLIAKFYLISGRWRHSYCIKCVSEYSKKRYYADPEKGRKAALARYRASRDACLDGRRERLYGVTRVAFDKQLRKQKKRCAICRTATPDARGGNWRVDHKHGRRKMRGLLCDNCNRGLGFLKDSSKILRAAARYLEAHQ